MHGSLGGITGAVHTPFTQLFGGMQVAVLQDGGCGGVTVPQAIVTDCEGQERLTV